jgi:F0F1-type ATP synthase epsilon subunit
METPDNTPAQIKAILLWVFSFLALIGVGVSDSVQSNIILVTLGFVTVVVPAALILADKAIRTARANNVEAILRSRDQYAAPEVPQG